MGNKIISHTIINITNLFIKCNKPIILVLSDFKKNKNDEIAKNVGTAHKFKCFIKSDNIPTLRKRDVCIATIKKRKRKFKNV